MAKLRVSKSMIRQAHVDNFCVHVRRNLLPVEAIQLARRVSIFVNNHDTLENVHGSAIRTIISWVGNQEGFQQSLGYSRLIRILDCSNLDIFRRDKLDVPGELFEQFHLRYLAFFSVSCIPKAISKLENLQTLIIHSRSIWDEIVKLPKEMWRMRQLRHLVMDYCVLPNHEEGMFALENLQTLTKAVNFSCSGVNLKMIPNLKKLGIILENWTNKEEDYEHHNLVYLQKLEILKIATNHLLKMKSNPAFPPTLKKLSLSGVQFPQEDMKMKPNPTFPPTLKKLSLSGVLFPQEDMKMKPNPAFPPTLKKLSLSGVQFPWKDMKIVASLPNLQELKLRCEVCIGRIWETSDGGFCQLNFLMIDGSNLVHWITKTSHFPRLKSLLLHHCWCLKEIPSDIAEIPTLELIEVDGSLLHSAKQIKHRQQSLGNDSLQVRIV